MKKGWTEVAFSEAFSDVTTGQPKTKTGERDDRSQDSELGER